MQLLNTLYVTLPDAWLRLDNDTLRIEVERETRLRVPLHEGRLMPGILSLLDCLKGREDCILALLTGNLARGAEIKLAHYGVWKYFEFGAFADDHQDVGDAGGDRLLDHVLDHRGVHDGQHLFG